MHIKAENSGGGVLLSHSIFCGDLTLQSPRGRGPCCFCQQLNLRGLGLDTSVLHLRSVSFDTNPRRERALCGSAVEIAARRRSELDAICHASVLLHFGTTRISQTTRRACTRGSIARPAGVGGAVEGNACNGVLVPTFFQNGRVPTLSLKKNSFTHISGIIDIK